MDSTFAAIFSVYAFFYIIILILSVVMYVFHSLAVHTIARRKGVPGAWMAWVPILSDIVLGKISYMPDKKRRTHIILPALQGAVSACFLLVIILTIVFVEQASDFPISLPVDYVSANAAAYSPMATDAASSALFLLPILIIAICGVDIAYSIVKCMALYRIYKQLAPHEATLYLVLSIIVSVTTPFLLFAVRNKPFSPYGHTPQPYAPYGAQGAYPQGAYPQPYQPGPYAQAQYPQQPRLPQYPQPEQYPQYPTQQASQAQYPQYPTRPAQPEQYPQYPTQQASQAQYPQYPTRHIQPEQYPQYPTRQAPQAQHPYLPQQPLYPPQAQYPRQPQQPPQAQYPQQGPYAPPPYPPQQKRR